MLDKRIFTIAQKEATGSSVVYVMSRDQRVKANHALAAAQQTALEQKLPLIVLFHLYKNLGDRAYEHAQFMIEGLEEVAKELTSLAIPFIMTGDDTDKEFIETLKELAPQSLYFDFSPLKGARQRVKETTKALQCSVYVVDTHNIIPTWVASDKQEFAAHTFRRKVHKELETYLISAPSLKKHPHTPTKLPASLTFKQAYEFIERYPKRGISVDFTPGEAAAQKALNSFIRNRLARYALDRNNIAEDHQSNLSPYFHFGQLSSLQVALTVLNSVKEPPLLFQQAKMASAGEEPSVEDGMNALFEEMIVRKELSDNFCFYASDYKSFKSLPEWSRRTLQKHTKDPRDHLYNLKDLEAGKTHDEAWNAAQMELIKAGKIHGYMRMYWAKKILEWTKTPEEALAHTIYLNDAYSFDGGDPNGYVGILWAIGGLHDRPWTERPIFGSIRYMNYEGLKRKFVIDQYINNANKL